MTPTEILARLQAEAERGFHKGLGAWVDDNSSVAKALRLAEKLQDGTPEEWPLS